MLEKVMVKQEFILITCISYDGHMEIKPIWRITNSITPFLFQTTKVEPPYYDLSLHKNTWFLFTVAIKMFLNVFCLEFFVSQKNLVSQPFSKRQLLNNEFAVKNIDKPNIQLDKSAIDIKPINKQSTLSDKHAHRTAKPADNCKTNAKYILLHWFLLSSPLLLH